MLDHHVPVALSIAFNERTVQRRVNEAAYFFFLKDTGRPEGGSKKYTVYPNIGPSQKLATAGDIKKCVCGSEL